MASLLQLVHRSVNDSENDGEERKNGRLVHALACPDVNDQHVEKGLERFHRVRQRGWDVAIAKVGEKLRCHHGDRQRKNIADNAPKIHILYVKSHFALVEKRHI